MRNTRIMCAVMLDTKVRRDLGAVVHTVLRTLADGLVAHASPRRTCKCDGLVLEAHTWFTCECGGCSAPRSGLIDAGA